MFCLHVYKVHHMHDWYPQSQKRASEPLELKLQTVLAALWVLGTQPLQGPFQEQQVLLTTEPSLQLPLLF